MRARDEWARTEPETGAQGDADRPRAVAPGIASLSAAAVSDLQRSSGTAAVCRALARRGAASPRQAAPPSRGATTVRSYDFTATIGIGPDSAPTTGGRPAVTSADAKP